MTGIGDACDENDARIAVDRARLSQEDSVVPSGADGQSVLALVRSGYGCLTMNQTVGPPSGAWSRDHTSNPKRR